MNLPDPLNDCFWLTAGKSQEELRASILNIEGMMHLVAGEDLPVKHYKIGNLYAREMFIPAGTVVVGKIHKGESISICSMGDISVMTELGAKRIKAPYTGEAMEGIKRVGFAHADTVWVSVHITALTDIDEIEQELTANNYEELRSLLCHSEQ